MLSPMMQQYMETKEQYKDCIVFYRLGDFYEMFFEDALTASKALEITLTSRDCGLAERAPMCGVPHHAMEVYANKLVSQGFKVAIAEQMEDPKKTKTIVRREVIRVITPGTNISAQALEDGKNNYLMCIVCLDKSLGIAICDVSTGEFLVTEVGSLRELSDEINKYMPSEIIGNEALLMSGLPLDDLRGRLHISFSTLDNNSFSERKCTGLLQEHFHVPTLAGLGLMDFGTGMIAAGALLSYLTETQKSSLAHITGIKPYRPGKYMLIDTSTRRNLELTETMREKQKRGSLLGVLDKTKTAMGARMLRSRIEQPLIDRSEILRRQDAIEELNDDIIAREELREYLHPIYDLERLIGRISYRTANPRDLIAFKTSLQMIPHIRRLLAPMKSAMLHELFEAMDPLEDISDLIERAILDDPPVGIREGGIIKPGYHAENDKLHLAKTEGKNWLAELEKEERERTGIKNLRIRYNKVFGYYLEVTNSYKEMVPEDYIRKQTLANAERFTTNRLKELENIILGAEDKIVGLEYELFCEVRDAIAGEVRRIQQTAGAIAALDVFCSLALVADRQGYVRPAINEKGIINIKAGRHAVVEQMLGREQFICNDTYLDAGAHRLSIITGPNMAGKSTYMRQVALIALMSQIGSFVPAGSADIGICDRIFTRVGASDDLASGQSTFMVEMTEVANILRNATRSSLLILDEIGRGTSTFDGLSIAWAVVEHIANVRLLGAKTLFATHYHELTELEGTLSGVNNYCSVVKEQGDGIVFLRKIVKGGADKSYGIQVAKLAGVPDCVIARARELAQELSDADITARAKEIAAGSAPKTNMGRKVKRPDEVDLNQMSLFDTVRDADIIKELTELNVDQMTPIDALNTLYRLHAGLKNRY